MSWHRGLLKAYWWKEARYESSLYLQATHVGYSGSKDGPLDFALFSVKNSHGLYMWASDRMALGWENFIYPKVGHGRLAVSTSVLLQFFRETSFRWSHFLYYSAVWKPAIIWEIWWELRWVYVSQIHFSHCFSFEENQNERHPWLWSCVRFRCVMPTAARPRDRLSRGATAARTLHFTERGPLAQTPLLMP